MEATFQDLKIIIGEQQIEISLLKAQINRQQATLNQQAARIKELKEPKEE